MWAQTSCGSPAARGLLQSCGVSSRTPTRGLQRVQCSALRQGVMVNGPQPVKGWLSAPTSSSWPGLTLPGRPAVRSEGQKTEQELGMLGGSRGWLADQLQEGRGAGWPMSTCPGWGKGGSPGSASSPTQCAGLKQAVSHLRCSPQTSGPLWGSEHCPWPWRAGCPGADPQPGPSSGAGPGGRGCPRSSVIPAGHCCHSIPATQFPSCLCWWGRVPWGDSVPL